MAKMMVYAILGQMQILLSDGYIASLRNQGFKLIDLELLTQDALWTVERKSTIQGLISQLLFGTMDAMGLQQIKIPAEYVACVGYIFIQPANWMQYAGIVANQNLETMDEMIEDPGNTVETEIDPGQIFAMILSIAEHASEENNAKSKVLTHLENKLQPKTVK